LPVAQAVYEYFHATPTDALEAVADS